MILLDPDLDPDPTSQVKPPARPGGSAQTATPRKQRIPHTRTLARFLGEAQSAVRLRGQVTVLLTTGTTIRRLNRQFRGKNKATDVLSFPANAPGPMKIAGDLAISVPIARRQAEERGHSLATEIKVLMLHGLLHLAGYDHEADSGQMARREQKLRAKLRLPHGLIERTNLGAPGLVSETWEGMPPAPGLSKKKSPAPGPESPAIAGTRRVRRSGGDLASETSESKRTTKGPRL